MVYVYKSSGISNLHPLACVRLEYARWNYMTVSRFNKGRGIRLLEQLSDCYVTMEDCYINYIRLRMKTRRIIISNSKISEYNLTF